MKLILEQKIIKSKENTTKPQKTAPFLKIIFQILHHTWYLYFY